MGFGRAAGVDAFRDAAREGVRPRTDGRSHRRIRGVHRLLGVEITDDVGAALDRMRRSRRCTSAAWAARRTTTTARRWRGAASPKPRSASRSCGSPGAEQEAVAAVPDEYLEQGALVGSEQRIRRALGGRCRAQRRHRRDRRAREQPEAFELLAELAGTVAPRRRDAMTTTRLILVDSPAERRAAHHAQPAREAQRHLDPAARRAARRAASPRPRPRRTRHRSSAVPGRASRPATTSAADR